MKIINPVYRQEAKVSARSFKLPLIVLVFNCVLAVVALLDMYTMIAQVRLTAELQYSSFLGLYIFVASVEFVLLLLFIPAVTAGSISGERERQTLDLMLTTHLTGADIVFGKLASSLSTIFLLIVSSFPILALVFIYGGVTAADVAALLLCYVTTALLVGSIGVFCSAAARRSVMATVASYCLTALLSVGTIVINYLVPGFADMTSVSGSRTADRVVYLLLCNPLAMFQDVIEKQIGGEAALSLLIPQLSQAREKGIVTGNWWLCCMAVQLVLSGAFLWGAVKSMNRKSNPRARWRLRHR